MLQYGMAVEMFRWNVNFSSIRNLSDGSTFPVVPFLFVQSNDLSTPLVHPSVVALPTPFPIAITIRLDMTPPAARVPTTISFTFRNMSSDNRFGRPFLQPIFLFFRIPSFQLFTEVRTNLNFG